MQGQVQLPGIFEPTIFSPKVFLMASRFIRAPHPKSEIRPQAAAIQKVLDAGWVGQLKIHGHRVQLHIPADPDGEILAYTRQGSSHKKLLSVSITRELRRLLTPKEDWNVIEGEWLKPKDKIYLFDFLKQDGSLLNRLSYQERYKLLPRAYISPHVQTLPLVTSLEKCLEILEGDEEDVEGLVFKSSSPGFADTSIVRCRKTQSRPK
jgi:ATP-dependent DNA ligase